MKKIIYLSLVLLLLSLSCTKEEQSPLEGAWRLVHEYQKSGDVILGEFPVDITGSEIKIWSGNHFIFVQKAAPSPTGKRRPSEALCLLLPPENLPLAKQSAA